MLLWVRRSTGKPGFMRRMPKTECPMKTTTLNVKPRLANPAKPLAQMPKRIQLSRKRGWRNPANTVVVSRLTKWGKSSSGRFARPRNETANIHGNARRGSVADRNGST